MPPARNAGTPIVRDAQQRLTERPYARLAEHVDYLLLRHIPGIGPINALTILAEAGDLHRFNHHRQFLKFCGLYLATFQVRHFPRSHDAIQVRGHARLRRTFWMTARVAARQRDNSSRDKLGRYYRLANVLGVGGVGLPALYLGIHIGRSHQPYLIPQHY